MPIFNLAWLVYTPRYDELFLLLNKAVSIILWGRLVRNNDILPCNGITVVMRSKMLYAQKCCGNL